MFDEKCNCGLPVRYSHGGFENGSCNKYAVCPTYDELLAQKNQLRVLKDKYEIALKRIVSEDREGYVYKAWADDALGGE